MRKIAGVGYLSLFCYNLHSNRGGDLLGTLRYGKQLKT
jgi:hypothetical protein